jgi:uncharacterized repeat protein (TIGR03803 family)
VTGGAPTVLSSFNGTDGESPEGSLTLSADGSTLYGMTANGGASNDGNIFSIPVTGGTPTILTSFNGTNGEHPTSSLTLAGSTLYGTTYEGGANNDGNVFSIPVTGGAPTVLSSFNGTNGRYPQGSLTLSADGSTLYGTTLEGGANNEGTVFSMGTYVVNPSGTTNTFTIGGSAVPVDAGVTVSSYYTDLTGATVTISAGTLKSGDTLNFTSQNGITGSYSGGVLTLSGSATPAQYQTALQSVTFSTTSTSTTTRSLSIVADDTLATPTTSYAAAESVKVAIAAPVVTPSGMTNAFTIGGSAVAVDAGVTVSSYDTDLTGATVTISAGTLQSGDMLHFSNQNGISRSYSGGVLTLSGSATPAQYETALQSVTFSTTSTNTTTRSLSIVVGDRSATPTTSNTGVDTVNVTIGAPVVTANQTSVGSTAGQTIAIDSAVTVTSGDTDVTGAAMTITNFQSGDALNLTNQNGITGSYTGGVLTLSGSATPAQYQTALASVTFSSTSTSNATRNISIVVSDSNDTGNVSSNTVNESVTVDAPITITGAWVENPNWGSSGNNNFFGYLASHGLGSATLGYALQTGANQLTVLPWTNINTISVSFSGPVSNIGQGSLELVGGTGGGATGAATAAPSVIGFTSDGNNTYSWTLSGNLTNNKYVFAIATTGSSFGTPGASQVVDANGAGISGTFTTSSSTFSADGNGLANSTFDFFFNVLPGDGNQNGLDNSSDNASAKTLANDHENAAAYNPYFDYNGAGLINTVDSALDVTYSNDKQSGITSPTAPAASQDAGSSGSSGFTALALGAQETGNTQTINSPTSTVSNVVPSGTTLASVTSAATTSTAGTASVTTPPSSTASTTLSSQTTLNRATGEALSGFDLSDLHA